MRGGLEGFLATGPLHPGFRVLRATCSQLSSALEGGTPVAPGSSRRRSSRTREYFLTQDGEPRRRQLLYTEGRCSLSEADWQVHRGVVFEHGADIVTHLAGLQARSQRARVAGHVAHVPRRRGRVPTHARRARRARFSGRAAERACSCSGRWRSSRRAGTGSSRATTTCWWTSSRTRAARSGNWCRCWCSRGARAPGSRIQGRCLRPSSSSATGSSRSTGFATRMSRCCARRARHLERSASRRRRPALDLAQLPLGARRSWPSSTTCVRTSTRPRSDPMHSGTRRRIAFRWMTRPSLPAADAPLGLVDRRRARGVRGSHGRRDRAAAGERAHRPRSGDRRASGQSRPATSPSCSARATATASSRRRSSERGLPPYVYKGLGFFDADEIKDVLALLWYLADPRPDLRAAALAAIALRPRVRRGPAGAGAAAGAGPVAMARRQLRKSPRRRRCRRADGGA